MSKRKARKRATTTRVSKATRYAREKRDLGQGLYQPSRTVRRQSTTTVTGFITSCKTGRPIGWEGDLELKNYWLLEANPSVVSYFDQPLKLEYEFNGLPKSHFPDVRVDFRNDTSEIWEVKPFKVADTQAFKDEVEVRAKVLWDERRLPYLVKTEKDIEVRPLLDNSIRLLSARNHGTTYEFKQYVADAFSYGPPPTLGALEAILETTPQQRVELWYLALSGHFDLDLESCPLSADTPITNKFFRNR